MDAWKDTEQGRFVRIGKSQNPQPGEVTWVCVSLMACRPGDVVKAATVNQPAIFRPFRVTSVDHGTRFVYGRSFSMLSWSATDDVEHQLMTVTELWRLQESDGKG